jgi:transcriptional regulator with XRE-family HTH domain
MVLYSLEFITFVLWKQLQNLIKFILEERLVVFARFEGSNKITWQLNWVSQQTVSKIEQSEDVDNATLEKIANVLGVSADAIKNFNEEVLIFHIQNMNDNSTAYSYNYQCHYNPLDKVVELYERLLASEREKIELLKNK